MAVAGPVRAKSIAAHEVAWVNRAVLLVDIVEFVRLVEEDEVGVISRWLRLVGEVTTAILPRCGGRLVKSLGDGMLLDFEDVRAAVWAALAIRCASERENAGCPPERQMLLRMGLELSDVILQEDDILGHGVNLAARLMSLAGPGEIVVSQRVRDRLTPDLDADIEDLGECFVRHLRNPIRAYRIGPPGPRPIVGHRSALDDLAPAIAVVPFAPRRTGEDDPVIGDVLAEETIRALSRTPDLDLISRLSTSAFRGRDLGPSEIGAHLSADYVLSGAYHCAGERVSLDLELAEAKSGRILWIEHLEDDLAGLLSGDQELIGRIVGAVGAAVMRRELQRSKVHPLPTLQSYTLLLGAITLMHRLSPSDFDEARKLLQTLADRRSREPAALAWLANWHVLRVQQGWSPDQCQDTYLALECTKRALDADPDCSLALTIDGFVHTNLLKRLDVARERYQRALVTNPSNARAWLLKGTLHAFAGEGSQAVVHSRRALQLSPLDPHRYFYDSLAATAYLSAHKFEHALRAAERSLRANRTHTSTLRATAIAQWQLGRHDEARRTVQQLLRLEPSLTITRWRERSPSAEYDIGKEWAEALRHAGVPD